MSLMREEVTKGKRERATPGLETRKQELCEGYAQGNKSTEILSEREVTWGNEGTIEIGSTTSKTTRNRNDTGEHGI